MQIVILAFAAFLGLQVAVEQTGAWVPFNKHSVLDFDAINHMLMENVPDDEIVANMALIKQAYEKKSREGSNSFVRALGKLVELDTILNPKRCDCETYDLLKTLDLGTRGKMRSWRPARRVDQVVKDYTFEHAQICYRVFPELVNATKKSVSEENLKYVSQIADTVNTHFTQYKGCDLLEAPIGDKMFHHFPIRYIIRKLSVTDPDARFLYLQADPATGLMKANEAKVKGLYNKYFYEPCKEFNDKVGERYFDLIKYDFDFRYDAGHRSMCKNTYWDSLAMSICHQVIHDKKFRKSSFNSLLKSCN